MLCNKIIIESVYGWGAYPQYSDELVIEKDKVTYSLKVEKMGKLIQTASCELFFDNFDYLESEVGPNDLLKFAGKAEFKIEQDLIVCDGGSLSLTIFYEDGSTKVVDAPGEEIKDSSPELFDFIQMLSIVVRGSTINPGYFEFEEESYGNDGDEY